MRLIKYHSVRRCGGCGHLIPAAMPVCPYCEQRKDFTFVPRESKAHSPSHELSMPDFSWVRRIPAKYIKIGLAAILAVVVGIVVVNLLPGKSGNVAEKSKTESNVKHKKKSKKNKAERKRHQEIIEEPVQEAEVPPASNSDTVDEYSSDDADFYDYDIRKLTGRDVAGKTKWQLEVMRNTIYARHGYKFKRDDLANHFSQYAWYQPINPDAEAVWREMNSIEHYNIEWIKKHER